LFYFSSKIFFTKSPKLFPAIISSIFIFSVFIGLIQLFRQKPLGKFIELTPSFSRDRGYSTTDGQPIYRVSGFISHPVYFGSFLSILIPIFTVYAISTSLPLSIPIILSGILVMIGTHSRTVWITLLLSFILLFPFLKQKFILSLSNKINRYYYCLILFLSISLIISRIGSLTQVLSNNGNGTIRLQLIWQSLQILSQHPLGVGLNQYTVALTELPIPANITGFIVPVHNTILLITTELGVLAGSLYIFYIIKSIFFKKTQNIVQYGAIVGAMTFLVSSQFHPLLNLDPTFDLFMLTLGYINSQCPPSKI
jgi:hypothetical protein